MEGMDSYYCYILLGFETDTSTPTSEAMVDADGIV